MTSCKIIFRTCGVHASYNNEEYQLVFEYDPVPTFKMLALQKKVEPTPTFIKQ